MSSTTGGYDCEFVGTPADKLVCQICQLVAHAPHMLTCCERIYCKACLDERKEQSHTCPNCRKRGQNFPDTRGEQEIESLKVTCNNRENGCGWVGELRSLDDHQSKCQFEKVPCKYAEIGCKEEPFRKDHENDATLHLTIETVSEQQELISELQKEVDKQQTKAMGDNLVLHQAGSCVFKMPEFSQHKSFKQEWYSPQTYTYPGGNLSTISRGLDVIAQTSVLVTNQAQTFNWKGYGLKLYIPQGALPAGLEECRLLIKVGLSGQFALPENTSLVSAVYWIDSEPRCKFSQHLTMEIQHCVKLTLASNLSFVHAKCSQKHLPYEFEAKEGGVFSTESGYGCVQLTHFSIWSLISKMLVSGVLYRARVYYLRKGVNRIDIHFVITKDLETHATVVQRKYDTKGATVGPDLPIEFEEDCISLQLPSEEESLESGWRIVPLCHPQITKEQVDSFTPSRVIPSCQLTAEWIGQGRPSRLSHKVTLNGAKEPSNFFHIVIDYDANRPERVRQLSTSNDTSEYSQAPIPEMNDMMEALFHTVVEKWKYLGIYLQLPMATLNNIATEHQNDPHKCLIGMLEAWLERVDPPPTWSAIIKAMEFLGEEQLARELREKEYALLASGSDQLKVKETELKTVDPHVRTGDTAMQQDGYLHGVEVIDHTSFMYTGQAHSFEWKRFGFKIHLPANALPPEADNCQLQLKASLSGQYQFPENVKLISGIYWITSPYKFTKSATVEIQHCTAKHLSNLTFIVAKSTQEDLPYQFEILSSGAFSPSSQYGSIQLTHFSGVAVAFFKSMMQWLGLSTYQPRNYCAQLYYSSSGVHSWEVYFVIVWDLELHISAVDAWIDEHTESTAKKGPNQMVTFEGEQITLDIGRKGDALENGWTITPYTYPGITKHQVDDFAPGRRIPFRQIYAEWTRQEEQPVELKHRVNLLGAKEPFDFFWIRLPVPQVRPQLASLASESASVQQDILTPSPVATDVAGASSPRGLGSRYAGLESEPQLSDLMNEVATVSAKWQQISIQLELTTNDNECFMASNPSDSIQCLTSVFKVWKSRATKPYTWSTVIEALKAPPVDEVRLAQKLTNKLTAPTQ